MTTLDWVIVALVALFGLAGYRRGFIVGALSLAGFVGGAVVGARVGPLLLPEGAHSPSAPLFTLAGALLLGGLLASGLERLGARLRSWLWVPAILPPSGPLRRSVTLLRGRVRSGNSGGPVVDARGRVLTTVFAATTGSPPTRPGGHGVANAVVADALVAARRSGPMSSGACVG